VVMVAACGLSLATPSIVTVAAIVAVATSVLIVMRLLQILADWHLLVGAVPIGALLYVATGAPWHFAVWAILVPVAWRNRTHLKYFAAMVMASVLRVRLRHLVVAATTAAISVGLVKWLLESRTEMTFSSHYAVGTVIVYALANSVTEEIVWRRAAAAALAPDFGTFLALTMSSLSFGVAHYAFGAPGGFSGAMAAAVFGASQGCLHLWSRSLVPPILVHVIVDIFILTKL